MTQTMVGKMNKGLLVLAALLLPGLAFADGPVTPAGTSSSTAANIQGTIGGTPMQITGTVSSTPSVTTYSGTMTLSAASSTGLIAANVTMAPNSAAIPAAGAFAKLTVINTGATNGAYVCWFGGTCSATAGGELLAAGASDTVNFTGTAAAPTLYSTSGTTLAFHN